MSQVAFRWGIAILFGAWLYPSAAQAMVPTNPARLTAMPDHPRICLALGGGGARGAALVGVLEALETLRIPVDCIAGTSMGAIIGGLYAAGLSAQQLQAILLRPDVQATMSNEQSPDLLGYQQKQDRLNYLLQLEIGYENGHFFFPEGFISSNGPARLLNVLTLTMEPSTDFNKLPIPFRAVATDVDTGHKVVLDHGNLGNALRASMSVPGFYKPVRYEHRMLVDGGLVDNLPVDVAREMGGTIIIAVNVSTPLSNPKDVDNVIGISLQVIKILANQNVDQALARLTRHDVLIQPDLGDITATDFNHARRAIRIGKATALKVLAPLHALQLSPRAYLAYKQRHRYVRKVLTTVDFIEIRGNRRIPTRVIRNHLITKVGEHWNAGRIDHDLEDIYQLGYFSSVSASIAHEGNRTGLVISVSEKPWSPNYLRFGLSINDDFEGDSQYGLLFGWTRAEINQLGAEWRNKFEIGNTRRAYTEFYQPIDNSGRFFVAPQAEYTNTLSNIYAGENLIAEYGTRVIRGGIDFGIEFGNNAELRIGPSYGRVVSQPHVGNPDLPIYRNTLGGIRLQFGLDTLQGDTGFPASGSYVKLNGFFARGGLGSDISFDKAELIMLRAFGNRSHSIVLTADVGSSFGTAIPFYDEFTLGGFLSLSGLRQQQLRGQQVFSAHAIYLKRVGSLPSILGSGLYVGASLEGGNVWDSTSHINLSGLQYGSAVFVGADTVLGPLYFGTGFSQSGHQSFYLAIGLPFTVN